jgi:hypothetical protein
MLVVFEVRTMGRQNGNEKTPEPEPPKVKTSFYNLCIMYGLYYDTMLLIAEQANVTKEVIDAMFVGDPVKQSDAVAVLAAFSETVKRAWTMETVKVPVLPESEDESHD